MTQKPFGVKQLNVIGVAGTPTIESAGSLNIGGQQVAITTNTSIAGVITATSFTGDGANITGISTSNITNYSGGGGGGIDAIGIQSAGTLVGTATTINFGSGATITNNVASVSVGSTTRFVGARMYHDDYSVTASGSWTAVTNFDGTSIDTNSFSNTTDGKFTIPAGVSKVKISTCIRVQNNGNINNQWQLWKNGSQFDVMDGGFNIDLDGTSGYNNPGAFGQTAIISVVEGDYFIIRYFVSNTTLDVDLWYQIEVVEGDILGTYFSANNIVEDTTPQLGGNLDLNSKDITGTGNANITGVVTATSFTGDGSALTGVVTSITAGSNITLTGGPDGAVTIAASGGTESDTLATVTARGDTTTAEITAANFRSNDTTGDGSDVGFAIKYYITANGASSYRFAGPGVLNSTDDPTLYFHRGFTYILENSTGSGHPFALRVSNGGADYAPGGSFLSGSTTGTQILTVPFDAPSSIVYQCTLHSGMVGTINFVS